MDTKTAQTLSELTQAFYAAVAPSFSATRQAPWQGWEQAWRLMDLPQRELRVWDVACGNLRFGRFLSEQGAAARIWAWDSCSALLEEAPPSGAVSHELKQLDLVGLLDRTATGTLSGNEERAVGGLPPMDLTVCFGFMHHLPLERQRQALMRMLAGQLAPDGYALVSFWQFADDERLRTKAGLTTQRARDELGLNGLGPQDYLLGWQGSEDVLRFCHHFTESEIDQLVACVEPASCEVARFSADGKSGRLNRYVVLRRTDR